MNPIARIRREIFQVTQSDMALIAGVAQSTISRWENGSDHPSLLELERIRAEARRRRLKLDDRAFFEVRT